MEKPYVVKNRVVTIGDARALALYLQQECERQQVAVECKLSFTAVCADGTKIPGADPSFFSSESSLNYRHVTSVSMRMDCGDAGDLIQIQLTHGNARKGSYIIVRGADPVWVQGTLQELITIIHSFTPRNVVAGFLFWPLKILIAIGFGAAVAGLVLLFYTCTDYHIPRCTRPLNAPILQWPFYLFMIVYGAKLSVGYWPAHKVMTWLAGRLPSVEMQIGPSHMCAGMVLRKWALLILPSIISLLGTIIGDFHGTNFR